MKESCYTPTGKLTLRYFLYFVIFSVISIPILSAAYIYLIHYIPFIYLNFLITAGCGVLLGHIIALAVKSGKARNPLVITICALVAVIVMKYVQWCVYIPMVLDDVYGLYAAHGIDISFWGRFSESIALFASPGEVYRWAGVINEVGVWGIRSSSYGAQATSAVTGGALLAVWIGEFLLMEATALMVSRKQAKYPFSEEFNGWYVKMDSKVEMDVPENFEAMKNGMENGYFAEFIQFSKAGKTDPGRYLALTFYAPPHPTYAEPYYLSIKQAEIKKRNKKKTKELVRYLAIDAQSVNELTAAPYFVPEGADGEIAYGVPR